MKSVKWADVVRPKTRLEPPTFRNGGDAPHPGLVALAEGSKKKRHPPTEFIAKARTGNH